MRMEMLRAFLAFEKDADKIYWLLVVLILELMNNIVSCMHAVSALNKTKIGGSRMALE